MYAVFDESLVTGNELIDSQHKELIDKINKLLECCELGRGKIEAIKTLVFLAEYTDYHFSAEEELQEKISYPGLAEHKVKHEELRKTVAELYEMLEEMEGPTDEFVEAVEKNVVDWLYRHIKGFDCSVATYMQMNNIAEMI